MIKGMIKKFIPSLLISFYRKHIKKFHGNEFLDKKMLKFINYKNGFYIEMGAHDGIINSNTYYFEKNLNWRGVLIEPSHFYENLKKNRSCKNIFHKTLCVPFNFDKKISFIDMGPYSKVSELVEKDYYNWHESKSKAVEHIYNKQIIESPRTDNLNNLLKSSNAPKLIDFFSLDVEGSELNVLKGVDFNQYNFQYLLIEITDIDKGKYIKKIKNFLKEKSYKLHSNLTSYDYLFKYTKI
jgi:hypothetical protein